MTRQTLKRINFVQTREAQEQKQRQEQQQKREQQQKDQQTLLEPAASCFVCTDQVNDRPQHLIQAHGWHNNLVQVVQGVSPVAYHYWRFGYLTNCLERSGSCATREEYIARVGQLAPFSWNSPILPPPIQFNGGRVSKVESKIWKNKAKIVERDLLQALVDRQFIPGKYFMSRF